ncbi:MAG TPA: TetR/AcrR family transcriptional regulator [Gammaproteobacteria bacterium]|nr:TetR/AcrR family transcriptional regulator [Gammaproteobacteria bacterium]
MGRFLPGVYDSNTTTFEATKMADQRSTQTSRSRLMHAGKTIMARVGYEQATTSAIAREAATSESQLMRYFGGKAGLLAAIFEESWAPMNAQIQSVVAGAADARSALASVLALFIEAFDRDDELAQLFLFEGRRMRGPRHEVHLSSGYLDFVELLDRLVRQGQHEGGFSPRFNSRIMVAALVGAAEAMVRERLTARTANGGTEYSGAHLRQVFEAMIGGFAAR